jgi:hypothetical protein
MMKELLIGSCFALVLAACATSGPSSGMAQAKNEARPPAGCVSDNTASRLPPSSSCAGPGGTHTQGDLKRTGTQDTDLGRTLQMLDPSITSHP